MQIAALTCPDGPRALVDYFCVAGLDSVHGLEPELFSEDSGLDLPPIRRPYRPVGAPRGPLHGGRSTRAAPRGGRRSFLY